MSDDPWWKGLRPLCLLEESWKEECCFLSHWEGQDQNGKGSGLGIWPKTSDGGLLSVRIVLSGQNSEVGSVTSCGSIRSPNPQKESQFLDLFLIIFSLCL